ncbi:MAG: universal stress protein [Gammaproteobacteria bacterium]|nr:universal stress protein [Gammaproteobacteria bacterium]
MAEFDHILVPIDGSEGSLRAARFAARLSTALDSPIKLAYVVAMSPESVMSLSHLDKPEVERIQQERARTVIESARQALGKAADRAEDVILSGDPAEEILHYISKNPKALIVMGRRGLSPVKSLLLGSVSERVMRHAESVVTLVN